MALVIFGADLRAQTHLEAFVRLSAPEKFWVAAHPFAARKAWRATERTRVVTDSLEKAGVLTDGNGGQLDAFRHTYWMALLVQEIAPRKARKLGRAHEKGNYRDWKKGRLEEGVRADSLACEMDLQNNLSGITAGMAYRDDTSSTKHSLVEITLHKVWNGELVIVRKNAAGVPLTCEGKPINLADYKNRWSIPKCLVSSDQVIVEH